MNISFFWKRDADGYTPVTDCSLLNPDGISLVDCILMDSGGLEYQETIPWLNEGLKRINAVEAGECEFSDWSRETWGVEMTRGHAKIYSLHDEAYFQILRLNEFSKVLNAWKDFLQSKPDDE